MILSIGRQAMSVILHTKIRKATNDKGDFSLPSVDVSTESIFMMVGLKSSNINIPADRYFNNVFTSVFIPFLHPPFHEGNLSFFGNFRAENLMLELWF